MSATSYLPRRWPSKYFRLNESFRPCSGWERVFSSRLVTDESFWLAHSKLHSRNKLNHQLLSILIICTITLPWCSGLRPCAPTSPYYVSQTCFDCYSTIKPVCYTSAQHFRKSPRPISITRLKMLPLVYL